MGLSIVIPIYNAEKYLKRCLESIANQLYSDIEVIMVNDGSTDSSEAICMQIAEKDNRFQHISIQNSGVSTARNIGLKNCNQEFVTFVDADDFVDKDYYENIMIDIGKADVVATGFKDVRENEIISKISDELGIIDKGRLIHLILTSENVYSFPWNKVFRRDMLVHQKITFDTKIHYGEDLIFDIESVLAANEVRLVSSDGYNYIRNVDSASGKIDAKRLYNRMTDMDAVIRTIELIEKDYPDEVPFLKKRIAREGMEYYYLAKKFKLDSEVTSEFYKKIYPYVKWVKKYAKKDFRWFKIMVRVLEYRLKSFSLNILSRS